jgi:hypothetical protein
MVAVGTRISPRPPHRSRYALLTHRAPPSGSGVEAVTRQWVYSSDWWKKAGDELDEPLPAEACRLAAPLERCEPEPLHLVEEPPQARVVKPRPAGAALPNRWLSKGLSPASSPATLLTHADAAIR